MSNDKPPNCVGFAYAQIDYKSDGYYDPDDVLTEFCEVPAESAELAVNVYVGPDGNHNTVRHVVPYPPNENGLVSHRPITGVEPTSAPFEEAIGETSLTSRILFVKRKEA